MDDVDGDGDTAEAICRDADARAQGCVPINVFGHNSISAAAADYIKAPGSLTTFTTQKLAGLNLSGSVFDLPAGPLGLAVGVEYRDEFARSEFDALQQAGLNAGNAIPRTEGGFDVFETYLEVSVPILADLPFADQLSVSAALSVSRITRRSATRTAGTRASSGRRFRRFASVRSVRCRRAHRTSTSSTRRRARRSRRLSIDPCVGVTATIDGTVADNCRAAPGVLENIQTNGAFTLNQADQQGISGFDSGQPGPERGRRQVVDGRRGDHAGQHRLRCATSA